MAVPTKYKNDRVNDRVNDKLNKNGQWEIL